MIEPPARVSRGGRWAEARERLMLVLSFLTVVLYLLYLRDHYDVEHPQLKLLAIAIDLAFLADFAWKLKSQGRAYMRTSWFLIDLLSCLPALRWIELGLHVPAIHYLRVFRFFRVLRVIRLMRVLKFVPVFNRLFDDEEFGPMTRSLHRSISIGVLATTMMVGSVLASVRYTEEQKFRKAMAEQLAGGVSTAELFVLGGKLEPSKSNFDIQMTAPVDGQLRTIYFDSDPVIAETKETEFFLVVVLLAGILIVIAIASMNLQSAARAQIRALLNLALPKQVADHFIKDPTSYDRKVRMPATILFTDYVGFTATCERLADKPDVLSEHLEKAMDQVVEALVNQDVIIDKFIGDAVMGFRGGPFVAGDPAEHAYRVVRGAIDGARALVKLNDPYFFEMKLGIASAPECLIGAFGTSARLSYTVLGDGVNLAARLEPASGQCATTNLCCEQTHALCAGRSDLIWRRWGRIRVKGKSQPMSVYEAFDAKTLGDASFLDEFHHALDAFEKGDFQEARDRFIRTDEIRPGGDPPSRSYISWCEELLQVGVPEDWEPVLPTRK
ncbi:hypothetical protein BH23PLA1_BH23PLA1_40760 [soil metagenome]